MDAAAIRRELIGRLSELGDPQDAAAMQAYMKSEMPYWGVKKPEIKRVLREVLAEAAPPKGRLDWVEARAAAQCVWVGAQKREELYLAVLLTGARRFRRHLDIGQLPFFEAWIVHGAWWDVVDDIAANRLGPMYAHDPERMATTMRAWAQCPDLWKRRSAIISQLKRKQDTDLQLLRDCIAPNIHRTEFWLRKAIGWALRQQGRFHPNWVRSYVAEHPELSGLSKREALKHLGA